MEPRDILAANPFFADVLGPDELDALAKRAKLRDFPHSAHLIHEDDTGSSLFIVASGEIAIDTGDRRTGKHIASGGPGTVVGEMSLMTGARRSANVTATTDVVALEVTRAALEPILIASPALVERFATMLRARQAELDHAYEHGSMSGMFGVADFAGLIRGFFSLRG